MNLPGWLVETSPSHSREDLHIYTFKLISKLEDKYNY